MRTARHTHVFGGHALAMVLAAMPCRMSHGEVQQGGPYPTGRPSYAQAPLDLLPPIASSGRETVARKYVDAGPDLKGSFLAYAAKRPGDYLEQEIKVGTGGRHEVVLWLPQGPSCGMFVVVVDDQRLGAELDGYAKDPKGPEAVVVGETDLTAGTHRVTLLATGRNPESRGNEIWIDSYVIRPKPEGQFISDWQVAGPFTGNARQTEAPPKEAVWETASAAQGVLDFGRQWGVKDNASAWARATIRSPREQETALWLGSDDQVTVWLNGEKVHQYGEERPALPDQDQVKVKLRRGENQLLCRVDNVKLGWQLVARPQDPRGELTVVVPELPRPESAELAQLGKRVRGVVVWESNRTGQWQLYRVNTDGSDFQQITDFPKNPLAYDSYLRPRVSPEGGTVLFGYGAKGKPCEVWLVPTAGGEARKLTVGNPLNWSPDGREIYFIRDSKVWRYVLANGTESLVTQATLSASGREGGTVGTVRRDLQSVALRSGRNEYVVFGQEAPVKTMGGCEAQLTSDGRCVYWVNGPKDFRIWEIGTTREQVLLGEPPGKWNYTYFPTVSPDNRWLAYGASPGQHSHDSSDYEIFLVELNNWQPVGQPVRLSFHPKTDRWPYLWTAR